MTLIKTLLLCYALVTVAKAQDFKHTRVMPADSAIRFGTPNSIIASYPNLEYVNASLAGGFSDVFIRSMGNPLVTVDGIPLSTNIFGTTPFREFFSNPQPLAFDIASTHPQPFLSNRTIVSGMSVNSVDIKTTDISGARDSVALFINNFTSALYQDPAERGYSIVNNAGFLLRRGKLASRLSVNDSRMDNYIEDMGFRRYGVNGKVQLTPMKNLRLTGYLDYSKYVDFRRTVSELDNNNTFTYLTTDLDGRWIDFRASISSLRRRETLFREIVEDLPGDAGGLEIYTQHVDYQSNGNYTDFSTTIEPLRDDNLGLSLELGWRLRSIKEPARIEDENLRRDAIEYTNSLVVRPEVDDQKFYGNLRFTKGIVSIGYHVDISKISFRAISASTTSDTTYANHFATANVQLFRNSNWWLESVEFSLKGGWINRCVIGPVQNWTGRPSGWVNPQVASNLEAGFRFTGASGRLNGSVKTYAVHDDNHFSRANLNDTSPLNYVSGAIDIGKVNRRGIETLWCAQLVDRDKIKWLMRAALSWNRITVDPVVDWWMIDRAANRVLSIYSAFTFGQFDVQVNALHKDGFEILRDDYGPTGEGPLAFQPLEGGYISHVDARGKTVLKSPSPYYQIHTVNFDIIENVKLTYTIDGIRDRGKLAIGLHYNQLRTLYSYMSEGGEYSGLHRSQIPSFYHVLSASVGISF